MFRGCGGLNDQRSASKKIQHGPGEDLARLNVGQVRRVEIHPLGAGDALLHELAMLDRRDRVLCAANQEGRRLDRTQLLAKSASRTAAQLAA